MNVLLMQVLLITRAICCHKVSAYAVLSLVCVTLLTGLILQKALPVIFHLNFVNFIHAWILIIYLFFKAMRLPLRCLAVTQSGRI